MIPLILAVIAGLPTNCTGCSFAGRDFDPGFLDSLPPGIDPCGENGEFHSFVCDAPVFSRPIAVQNGEIVTRDGFVFADVLPADVLPADVRPDQSASSPR